MPEPTIPFLGLGTGGDTFPTGTSVETAVELALEIGYRHIDTAPLYGNQRAIARGIANSDVPRDKLILSTKISPTNLDYDGVHESLEQSLDRLNTAYVDILYVHFPTGAYSPKETFAAFNDLYAADKIDAIGVSNFTIDELETATAYANPPIQANQVELHPWCQQDPLRAHAQSSNLTLVGYCPLIRGQVFQEPVIQQIAEKHDASPAQVALAWLHSMPYVRTITKSTSFDHLQENHDAQSLELDVEDTTRIEAIEREEKLVDTTQT